ncbi:MAG: TetR/AcrR family transcriptional regulator [Oscillospiraceae bacterium]
MSALEGPQMYQGSNPIAKRSQDWLAEALLELLKTKAYAQISIKDICGKAGLSRQTFYQMFDSKEEVARYAVRYRQSPALLRPGASPDTARELKQVARQFARAVRSNQETIQLYRKNNLQYLLYEEISRTLASAELRFGRKPEAHIEPLANAFFTGALARSLLILADHEEISEEAFADFFCGVLQGAYYAAE